MLSSNSSISLILIALCLPTPLAADEESKEVLATVFPDGRHLVQLAFSRLDSAESDSHIILPRYTYAYSQKFRFTIQAPYVTVDNLSFPSEDPLAPSRFDGFGDVSVLMQFDPSAKLSANAFVPDTLGFTFGLQLPTGKHRQFLGTDAWVANVGSGWLIDFLSNSWILPSLNYSRSFDTGPEAVDISRLDATAGFYWLFSNASWLGIEPKVGYDFVLDEPFSDISIVIGKAWKNGLAVDLSYGNIDRIDAFARRDDRELFFVLSYQFGRPPKRSI